MHTPHHRTPSHPNRTFRARGILVLAALAPTTLLAQGDGERVDPNVLVRTARERLEKYESIDTDIVQTLYFGTEKTESKGHYSQGRDQKLRLEFDVRIGRVKANLLQVCDGEELWTQRTIAGDVRVTRRSIPRILSAARKGGRTGEEMMLAELALGGIPGMLAAVEDATDFGRSSRDERNGLHIVSGRWTPKARAMLEKTPALAPFTPDRVEIAIDENLFPRRIQYLRDRGKGDYERLVTLEFRNTKLGVALPPETFTYTTPPGVFPKDVTDEYIKKLQPPTAPMP